MSDFERCDRFRRCTNRQYWTCSKPKVEAAVLLVQRWILVRLRNRRLFSLVELNRAIAELLADLNQRPFRKDRAVPDDLTDEDLEVRLYRPALARSSHQFRLTSASTTRNSSAPASR
jgi:hypothetical protein